VLVTSGRYAEMIAGLVEPVAAGIKGTGHVVFHDSSHLAMAEEPDRYRAVLGFFLGRVEAGRHPAPHGVLTDDVRLTQDRHVLGHCLAHERSAAAPWMPYPPNARITASAAPGPIGGLRIGRATPAAR
jgi:hypothetical protein